MIFFILLLLTLAPFIRCINLTYIVKMDGNKIIPSCIAEEFQRYEAVGWVYPIPADKEGIPHIRTQFIPTINNDYNCKFTKYNICSKRWTSTYWSIDYNSATTQEFIADYRWEDLPTMVVSNKTKEFKKRIEISKFFKSGISVRAGGGIELFICSGWNPYNYPCYHFNIDRNEVYLNKYAALPRDLNDIKLAYLEYYKANSNIVAHDEWRNFIISFDENGIVKLFDVNLNRTVIHHVDNGNFNPMYLLVRSDEPSLWKFHQNQFLYADTIHVSQFGPLLTLPNKDLCISLLVSLCEHCELIFFYKNMTTRRVLKQVRASQNNQWMEIKLMENNPKLEELNIFVETKFRDDGLNQTGFWAIDNVRICTENEVKVTDVEFNDIQVGKEKDIFCQLVKKPSLRPKRYVNNEITDYPRVHVKRNSTSIKLSWQQEDPINVINYFVLYQANNICTTDDLNVEKTESTNILTTKNNEILIENLVPYTLYNITISTVPLAVEKYMEVYTLETEAPTFQEVPQNVQLRTTDSAVYVSWQEVPCSAVYGRLIYTLTVFNAKLDFQKQLSLKTDISYTIDGLHSDTSYSLNITTARNAESIDKGVHSNTMTLNFKTLPGVAQSVENLELYSIDQNSASFRYDLPKDPNGVPTEIQVNECYTISSSKCRPNVFKVEPCYLWPKKWCVVMNNLIPYQNYTFKISLKNLNTNDFGKEVTVFGFTTDRVPGPPTNLTYKTADCNSTTDFCHFNVMWSHPYNENGIITLFNIIVQSTDTSKTNKYVYTVPNKSYSRNYTYQVKAPYSTQYILSVQSVNAMYKSSNTTTVLSTHNSDGHFNQNPELLKRTDNSLMFKISPLNPRQEYYILRIIVQDFDVNKTIKAQSFENSNVFDKLCHTYGNTWISQSIKVRNNSTDTITIGSSDNIKLQPKTQYCVTFIITNKYRAAENDVVYHIILETLDAPFAKETNTLSSYFLYLRLYLYILLLLLLLVPLGVFIYRYVMKRRIMQKTEEAAYHIYESLSFYGRENDHNYDHLLHK